MPPCEAAGSPCRRSCALEFCLPDEKHRERLWRGMFPPQAPPGADVDFAFLACQFDTPGGDIKNVVLDAAFRAGRVIGTQHLVRALARQNFKRGKIPSSTDFQQYLSLVAESE